MVSRYICSERPNLGFGSVLPNRTELASAKIAAEPNRSVRPRFGSAVIQKLLKCFGFISKHAEEHGRTFLFSTRFNQKYTFYFMSSNVGSGFRAVILFFKNFKIGLPLYNMQQSVPELFYFHNVFLKNTVRPILAEPNRTWPNRTVRVRFVFGSCSVRFGKK